MRREKNLIENGLCIQYWIGSMADRTTTMTAVDIAVRHRRRRCYYIEKGISCLSFDNHCSWFNPANVSKCARDLLFTVYSIWSFFKLSQALLVGLADWLFHTFIETRICPSIYYNVFRCTFF